MPGHLEHNIMQKTILEFRGVRPVRITEIGPIKGSTEEKRKGWIEQVRGLGSAVGLAFSFVVGRYIPQAGTTCSAGYY